MYICFIFSFEIIQYNRLDQSLDNIFDSNIFLRLRDFYHDYNIMMNIIWCNNGIKDYNNDNMMIDFK